MKMIASTGFELSKGKRGLPAADLTSLVPISAIFRIPSTLSYTLSNCRLTMYILVSAAVTSSRQGSSPNHGSGRCGSRRGLHHCANNSGLTLRPRKRLIDSLAPRKPFAAASRPARFRIRLSQHTCPSPDTAPSPENVRCSRRDSAALRSRY